MPRRTPSARWLARLIGLAAALAALGLAAWPSLTRAVIGEVNLRLSPYGLSFAAQGMRPGLRGMVLSGVAVTGAQVGQVDVGEVTLRPRWSAVLRGHPEASLIVLDRVRWSGSLAPTAEEPTPKIPAEGDVRPDPAAPEEARPLSALTDPLHRGAAQAQRLHEAVARAADRRLRQLAPHLGEGLTLVVVGGCAPLPDGEMDVCVDGRFELPGATGDDAPPTVPLRMRVGFGEGGARLALEGRWTPGALTFDGEAVAEAIPVGELLPGAAPEWVSRWPTLSGDAALRLQGDRVDAEGAFELEGLGISHPRLAAVPVEPIDTDARVDLSLSLGDVLSAQILRWEGELAGIPYRLGGRATVAEDLDLDLRLRLEKVPFQALLEAVPAPVIPEIAGYELGGALDLDVRVQGPLLPWEETDIDVDWDASTLSLVRGRLDRIPGGYPLEGMPYVPVDPEMAELGFPLSRTHRGWATLMDIPPACIDAVVMAEDVTFFHHRGFDLPALKDALSENLEEGKTVRGGSTITQQLAKNLYLSGERTVARKLQEAVLTWELENRLTKKQILETYLNIIEWGPGIYGIGPAAWHFFGVAPRDLSVKQCVYLATVIPGPRKYYVYYLRGELSPTWEVSVQTLLDKLYTFEKISGDEYLLASDQPVVFYKPQAQEGGQPGGMKKPWKKRGGKRGRKAPPGGINGR